MWKELIVKFALFFVFCFAGCSLFNLGGNSSSSSTGSTSSSTSSGGSSSGGSSSSSSGSVTPLTAREKLLTLGTMATWRGYYSSIGKYCFYTFKSDRTMCGFRSTSANPTSVPSDASQNTWHLDETNPVGTGYYSNCYYILFGTSTNTAGASYADFNTSCYIWYQSMSTVKMDTVTTITF